MSAAFRRALLALGLFLADWTQPASGQPTPPPELVLQSNGSAMLTNVVFGADGSWLATVPAQGFGTPGQRAHTGGGIGIACVVINTVSGRRVAR